MKPLWTLMIVALLVALAAGAGYWLGHRGANGSAEPQETEAGDQKKEAPVAIVRVAPIRQGAISESITAYGSIVAPTNDVRVVSVPFEARASRLLVSPGQVVSAGQPLIEVEGSPATQLQYQEAQNALTAAQRDQNLVQQRFQQHLATNTELFTAESTLKTAQVRLQNLEQSGAGKPAQLKTDVPGIVSKVDVQIGQIVPAGGPLVEIAGRGQIVARLGINPEDVRSLTVGQPVSLTRVADSSSDAMNGTIRLIGERVDPASHLVDVFVQPPGESKLLLDDFVSGTMSRTAAQGLLVPRDAVLPAEDNKQELFTVNEGKAVKHDVQIGIQTDRETQVIADDLKPGQRVIISGNLEVEDGMAVRTEEAPAQTQPADENLPSTQPAPAPPAETPTPTSVGGAQP